jgi:glucose-1-phosphate thymidylyltransferase
MVGIILCGGTGSRLFPLTKVTNKHLLPVGRKPMIFHAIEKLTESGIYEILIVTGVDHMGDIVTLLGSGKEFNCKFTYSVQDQAGGIAQALGLARHFARGDKMAVILGDNIFEDSIKDDIAHFSNSKSGAHIILKSVPDPCRYGVAEFINGVISNIEEKPKEPKTDLAVTGIYFYDDTVFNIIDTLKPSKRGELEITDVNNSYIKNGRMTWSTFTGWWTDAGTFDSLEHANSLCK